MKILLTKLFYPVFFVLFILSFFLMETDFNFYLFVAWSIFLVFYNSFVKSNIKSPPSSSYWKKIESKITFFCLLFLFFALISGLFSHQLPLFFEKYLFYLFSIVIFLFFLKVDKKLLKTEIFIEYLLLLTSILNVLVLFLTINGNSRTFFQGMNLLIRNYGHNHYIAFLLLILPLVWWSLFKKVPSYLLNKKLKLFLDVFLLISSYLLVLIALSRWGLLIVITQFISIFLLNKQFFYNLGKNKLIYSLFKSSVFLFLFISLIFIFLSLPLSNNGNKTCFLKIYRKDLCISVTENSRFFYWRQAYLTFKNNPIFGYGLDSFKHAARRFPLVNEQHSAYAHNIFLHNLAEMGVIGGGLFIFLIIYIFYQSISNLKKSKITVNNFLYIGAMSSLLNAMFDFDWHFFVIFLLTLIFLAFILRSRDSQKIEGKNDKFWKIFSSILFFASATLLIANVLTIRWQKKRPEYWLKYTPFYNISAEAPYDDSINTVETYSSLYDLYRYDTGFILRFLNFDKELDESLKLQLYLDLAEIDPASFVSKITYKDWGLNEAKILSDQLIRILEKHPPLNNNYFFGYWKRMELAKDLFNLAEEAYQKKDWQLANYFYQTAHLLDSYILFNQEGSYLKEENTDNLVEFLPYLQNISPFEIKDFNRYMFLYREVSTELFKQNRLEEFKKMTSSMIEHDPNAKWYLIDHLYNSLENEEQDLVLQEIE